MHHPALASALVVLHVVAAVTGFGFVAVSGVYAGTARHLDRPGAADEARRFFAVRAGAEWSLLAVPLLGLAVTVVRGDVGQAWVAIALMLWAVAASLVFAVVRPARSDVRAALGAATGGDERRPLAAAATRLARAAAAVDVVFVLAVVDMVYRPGH